MQDDPDQRAPRGSVSRRSQQIQAAAPFRMLFGFLRRRAAEEAGRREPRSPRLHLRRPARAGRCRPTSRRLREAAVPRDELWFAYKQSEPPAQDAAAASLERVVPLGWTGDDLRMTTGGFGAITVAMKAVADPGDEVVYTLPPWFLYEILAIEAGLVPVKVPALQPSFDLDLDAIAAAITPRTRIVVVNTPNNPTGRIYPPATLHRPRRASSRRPRPATGAASGSSPTSRTTGSSSTGRLPQPGASSTRTRCSATATARRCSPPASASATSPCRRGSPSRAS